MSNTHFYGQGVQNSGSGGVIVGGDLNIGISENEGKCLIDLYVTDPRHDKKRIEEAKGGLLPESYAWVLKQDHFLRWRHGTPSRLLWIRGDPGKGKTMLLCGIINDLEKEKKGLLSFFFCQITDRRLSTSVSVLRGLIYHLIGQRRPLLWHVLERYKNKGKQLFEDNNSWVALAEIFEDIIKDIPGATFVIDGLDECETDLPQLIELIVKLSSSPSSKVKWIVSSRNWMEIDEQLKPATQLRLELNESSISNAVLIYIRFKVERLANLKGYSNELRKEVEEYLSSNANNTFLWVALACAGLADPRVRLRHTRTVLHKFPPGLYALYDRMMGQIVESNDADNCKHILAIMSVTYQPPKLVELVPLVDPEKHLTDCLEEIIQLCGSFLVIREETVFFVHQSAKEYILDHATSRIFPSGIAKEHHAIFERSIIVMSQRLRRNIYRPQHWMASSHGETLLEPDPLAAIRYACIHWGQHLEDSHLKSQAQYHDDLLDGGFIDRFLRKHYLHWLEALGFLRSVTKGTRVMTTLSKLLKGEATQLNGFVQDASQFIRHNREAISESPLQTYVSALFFSPHQSTIWQLFQNEKPPWLILEPALRIQWPESDCHHRTIVNMIFSSTGRHLTAYSYDGTASIWDAVTGEWMNSLPCNCWNDSTIFSPDGTKLASILPERTIYILDTSTNMWLEIVTTHHDYVYSIAFSPDGYLIASGSEDRTIQIWDTTAGVYLTTLTGHSDTIFKIAFSPDGRRLASCSYDRMIKIWDTETETCLTEFVIHYGGEIESIAFSPDGNQLATGLSFIARVWDTRTGTCSRPLGYNNSCVTLVAFSPDGRRLVTVGEKNVATVWDVATGTRLVVLVAHWSRRGYIETIAFSPDGNYLITDTGTLPLPKSLHTSASSSLPSHNHYDFHLQNRWLTFKGQQFLRIPSDYCTYFSVTVRTIAIGCRSGQVWFFSSRKETDRNSRVHFFKDFDNDQSVI